MKILMLTDSMDVGGAETHIRALAAALRRKGHSVTVCSSGGAMMKKLTGDGISHVTLPLGSRGAMPRCYLRLCSLISRGGFDMIHAHARLPALLGRMLSRRYSLPLVVTAHARFSLSPLRRLLSCWGDKTVAVSEDIKHYLTISYGLAPENITVIPNGMDTHSFQLSSPPSSGLCIATLSRLDRDCASAALLLCSMAPRLVSSLGVTEILVGGGGDMLSAVRNLADDVNRRLGFRCIKVVGRVDDVSFFMKKCHIFVGVSRAAAEAALCGRSVIICGNEGYLGRLTEGSFSLALSTNFCARGCPRMSPEALFCDIREAVSEGDRSAQRIRELLSNQLDVDSVVEATERIYGEAASVIHSKRPQILLCGYYGFGNMGDDALLRSSIARARREYPSASVGALTKGGKKDSAIFGVPCFKRSSPFALRGKIKCCELFVLGGGTLLQEDTSLRSLAYYCALIAHAKRHGATVHLWGNGIGVPKTKLGQALMRRALRRCDSIGLRDGISVSLAHRLTPDGCIYFEKDLALRIPRSDALRADFLLETMWGDKIPDFILVAPKSGDGIGALEAAVSEARSCGFSLCFVAMHTREDTPMAERLRTRYGGEILCGICYSDLVAIAARSKGVYSMRLHGLLAAASAKVPYRAFGNDVKLKTVDSGE